MSSDAVFIDNIRQAFIENFFGEIVTTSTKRRITLN
jgi:hypothetical protein